MRDDAAVKILSNPADSMCAALDAASYASFAEKSLISSAAFWTAGRGDLQKSAFEEAERHLRTCADMLGFNLVKREPAATQKDDV